jgi:hypothetical protein
MATILTERATAFNSIQSKHKYVSGNLAATYDC